MSYLDPSFIHAPSFAVAPQYQPFGAGGHLQTHPTAVPPFTHGSLSPEGFPTGGQLPSSGKTKGKIAYKESPVKAACLTCRAKKAKCDGVRPICGACAKKSIECQYVKSRRGGARKKREVPTPSALQEFLKKLDGLMGIPDFKVVKGVREPSDDTKDIVREFSSREEILRCYYNELHPFVPVMPIRKHLPEILPTLLPVSPFLLAAQTILVLVPHPKDPHPASADSKRLRSAASHAFAEQATDAIERLIETGHKSLESVQALTMLALWEWGSSGSVHKNRARTSQASQLAMEMNLHDMDRYSDQPLNRALEGSDWQKDMARRTWWSTYVNQLTSAMVTGTTPILSPDDERVHVHYPVCSIDDKSWPHWIETNRQCTRVFGIVNSVYYGHLMPGAETSGNSWGSHVEETDPEKKAKMRKEIFDVDAQITEMMRKAEETAVIELVPGGEEEVVRNQQLSSRLGLAVVHIHIHRHQAFPEVSLFSKQICGLPKMPDLPGITESGSVEGSNAGGNVASSVKDESVTSGDPSPKTVIEEYDTPYEFVDEMWQPDTFPESLPDPWFSQLGGAAALYAPVSESPTFYPPVSASIASYHSPEGSQSAPRRPSTVSVSSNKPHKAWGVDDNDKPDQTAAPIAPTTDPAASTLFPPGVSLARCATAAHTIVRLEVLHRSAVIAMWDGPPKWMPFCACGLVTGAYSFLLLALAVQAESLYSIPTEEALDQIDGLLTNVKVIVAGLEAYGTMWAGIDVMASEVRAALDAATQLPFEIRKQLDLTRSLEQQQQQQQQQQSIGYVDPGQYAGSDYSNGYQYPSSAHADLSGLENSMRFTELSPGTTDSSLPMSAQHSLASSHGMGGMNGMNGMHGMNALNGGSNGIGGANGYYGLAGPAGMGHAGGGGGMNGAGGGGGGAGRGGEEVSPYGHYGYAQMPTHGQAQGHGQVQPQPGYTFGNGNGHGHGNGSGNGPVNGWQG